LGFRAQIKIKSYFNEDNIMDGRDILIRNEKIQVLLDSETFIDLLKKDNRIAKAILKHYNSD